MFSRLAVKRFAFDVELLAFANLYGLKMVELPVNIRLRRGSFSLREVWRMFIDLLGITYGLRVLKWYQRRYGELAREAKTTTLLANDDEVRGLAG